METRTLAELRAADQELQYRMYFPNDGRVKAAAVVGCVCLDDVTCTECERILGQSFLAIELAVRKRQRTDPPVAVAGTGSHGVELAVRKKQRTDPPVAVARVEAVPGTGSHGVELAVRKKQHTDPPMPVPRVDAVRGTGSHGVELAVRKKQRTDPPMPVPRVDAVPGTGSHGVELAVRKEQRTDPPVPVPRVDAVPGTGSHGIEGSDAAVSGMTDRLVRGSHTPPDGVSDTAAGMADRSVPCLPPPSDEVEGSDAAVSGMADQLRPASHPPLDVVEGSDAAISGTADRIAPCSLAPSDGVEGSDAVISSTTSMADLLAPSSQGGVEGFEAGISGMAARLGLEAAVGERAQQVFRKMEEARAWRLGQGRTRCRSKCPLAYAACLSIACRNEGSARSLRELALAAVAGGGPVARKEIYRLVEHIRKRLGEEEAGQAAGIGTMSVSSYLRRFGAYIKLGEAEKAAALEAGRRLDEGALDVRHNPELVAAAVVCLALERTGPMRAPARSPASRPWLRLDEGALKPVPGVVKDVAAAISMPTMTIDGVCRKLRPHAELLFG